MATITYTWCAELLDLSQTEQGEVTNTPEAVAKQQATLKEIFGADSIRDPNAKSLFTHILRASILQANQLMPKSKEKTLLQTLKVQKDKTQTDDPYATLKANTGCVVSPVVPKTVNPAFNTTLELPADNCDGPVTIALWNCTSPSSHPPEVKAIATAPFGRKDRFLGQVVFQYKDLPIFQTIKEPEKHRLDKRQKRSNVHGTITMSVGVVPQLNVTPDKAREMMNMLAEKITSNVVQTRAGEGVADIQEYNENLKAIYNVCGVASGLGEANCTVILLGKFAAQFRNSPQTLLAPIGYLLGKLTSAKAGAEGGPDQSDLRSSLQPVATQLEDLIAKYPSTKDADAVETMIRAYTDVDAIDREHGLNLQYFCEGDLTARMNNLVRKSAEATLKEWSEYNNIDSSKVPQNPECAKKYTLAARLVHGCRLINMRINSDATLFDEVFKAHHVDVLATDHEVLVKEHARLTHELLASTDMADPAMDELLRSASYQTLYTVVTQMEGTLNDKVYSTHPDLERPYADKVVSFYPTMMGWIRVKCDQVEQWTANAMREDTDMKFIDESLLHSSSVVDVFAAYTEIVQFVADLKWPEEQHLNMSLELVKRISMNLVKYADWLDHETEIEQLKLERTALEAESTDGAQPKRQSSLNAAKDKMRTMRTAAHAAAASLKKTNEEEVVDISNIIVTPKVCAAMNNTVETFDQARNLLTILGPTVIDALEKATSEERQDMENVRLALPVNVLNQEASEIEAAPSETEGEPAGTSDAKASQQQTRIQKLMKTAMVHEFKGAYGALYGTLMAIIGRMGGQMQSVMQQEIATIAGKRTTVVTSRDNIKMGGLPDAATLERKATATDTEPKTKSAKAKVWVNKAKQTLRKKDKEEPAAGVTPLMVERQEKVVTFLDDDVLRGLSTLLYADTFRHIVLTLWDSIITSIFFLLVPSQAPPELSRDAKPLTHDQMQWMHQVLQEFHALFHADGEGIPAKDLETKRFIFVRNMLELGSKDTEFLKNVYWTSQTADGMSLDIRDPRSITFSVALEYTDDVKRATVQVIRANGLPNLSKKGVSYVFAEAHVFADTPGKYGYTVIKAALEPEWNETIVLDLPSTDVHPPLVQVAAYHRKKARSQNVARVAREGATVEKDVVFQEADDNMYQLIGETVVSLEDMDNGQTQEFTKSLVPIVNQDSKTVLEILASRVDEKEAVRFAAARATMLMGREPSASLREKVGFNTMVSKLHRQHPDDPPAAQSNLSSYDSFDKEDQPASAPPTVVAAAPGSRHKTHIVNGHSFSAQATTSMDKCEKCRKSLFGMERYYQCSRCKAKVHKKCHLQAAPCKLGAAPSVTDFEKPSMSMQEVVNHAENR